MINTLDMGFFIRFLINTISLFVLVKYCYYRRTPNREFLFSFFLFGTGVFIVSFLLRGVEVSMGFAFGLFAIFSMLRYRTEAISIKSMTYLFLVITVSLLSAVGKTTPIELMLINALLCLCASLAESKMLTPQLAEYLIRYEKIENIRPQNRQRLLDDLHQRTGFEIRNVVIDKIDFLRDTATLRIFYVDAERGRFVAGSSNPTAPFFRK
jgi:signal transduction histidine kinase